MLLYSSDTTDSVAIQNQFVHTKCIVLGKTANSALLLILNSSWHVANIKTQTLGKLSKKANFF